MYIKVRVSPGAKVEAVVKKSDELFDIAVKEPAERNLANRRVVALLAAAYRVPPGRVRIVSGHRSPHKILAVEVE